MLIVEGSDCLGKTTFVNSLCVELERRGFPAIPQHFGLLPDCWDYYESYLPFINRHTVMDRFILSEVAYGQALRGSSKITDATYHRLDANLLRDGSVTVLLLADTHDYALLLKEKFAERQQEFDQEALITVNETFHKLMATGWYDVDFVHFVRREAHTLTWTWPSERVVQQVVDLYLERQRWTQKDC